MGKNQAIKAVEIYQKNHRLKGSQTCTPQNLLLPPRAASSPRLWQIPAYKRRSLDTSKIEVEVSPIFCKDFTAPKSMK